MIELLTGISPTLIGIGAVILAAIGGLWKAYSAGKKSERAKQDRASLDAVRKQKEIRDEVDDLGPADLDREFERYRMRNKP